RTPHAMRSYSILLLNSALIELISAIGNGLSSARVGFGPDGTLITLYVGPCSLVGVQLCHISYCVHLFSKCQGYLILLQSFCFRLYIISVNPSLHASPTRMMTLLISAVLYAP
ncbi:hypothetical protein PFISCL1PPCAC_3562, partial [Pristionchus fissidentatus]